VEKKATFCSYQRGGFLHFLRGEKIADPVQPSRAKKGGAMAAPGRASEVRGDVCRGLKKRCAVRSGPRGDVKISGENSGTGLDGPLPVYEGGGARKYLVGGK